MKDHVKFFYISQKVPYIVYLFSKDLGLTMDIFDGRLLDENPINK